MNGSEQPRILIVDDQPRNLDVLEAMLGDMDCLLVRAASADEALLALVRHDFAALVLDIRMPGMSSIELATLIKQRKRSQHVPILFLTAHSVNEDDVLRGYGVGAVDYLSKPVNPEILRSKVGVFVDLFRKTRALAVLNDTLQSEVREREEAQAALGAINQELERRVSERTLALSRAHQGVRENEERLQMALDVAQIAAWEWHLASGQMRWSTDPEVLFGFPKGSFGPNLRITCTAHPDDRSTIDAGTSAAIETGLYEATFRAVRPDGTIAWITERGRVFPDVDSDRMVGISRDVTAERQAAHQREELLRQARDARDEAERQSRVKDEFLATLSHELRTPMNVVLGWLHTLQKVEGIQEIRAALAVIQRNAQIQAKLIDDLLDMNRLVSGTLRIDLDPVDIVATLQSAIQGLQPVADAKGVHLTADLARPPLQVLADSRRLVQILWNIVHNAIKFTPTRGRIDVTVEERSEIVCVLVRDTGQGIAQAFLPHVFERFRQEDASATREGTGLGLGLSIAKHLAELHGGTIRAASAGKDAGATFCVELRAAGVGRQTAPENLSRV